MKRFILVILAAALALAASGCEPFSDPIGTSEPETDAETWRGTYTGRSILNCDEVGAVEREMETTLRLMPARDELNIQLFLVPDLNYMPKFRYTGPVANERHVNFAIEDELFIYCANLYRTDDRVTGELWVCNLQGQPYWEVICIEVERD